MSATNCAIIKSCIRPYGKMRRAMTLTMTDNDIDDDKKQKKTIMMMMRTIYLVLFV